MSATREGHIEQLRGMLANADFLARLPDGGEKLRVRLRKLLGTEDEQQTGAPTAAADSARVTKIQQQRSPAAPSRPVIISANVSLAEVMHKTFDTVLPRREVARLCGEPAPADDDDEDATDKKSRGAGAAAGPSPTADAAAGNKVSSSSSGSAGFGALKLLSWEETLQAQNDMLEDERLAELERIRARMQLFVQ